MTGERPESSHRAWGLAVAAGDETGSPPGLVTWQQLARARCRKNLQKIVGQQYRAHHLRKDPRQLVGNYQGEGKGR